MFWYGQVASLDRAHRIAVIPGDGVGPEVVRAGLDVLCAVQRLDNEVQLSFDTYPWGSQYYREHGEMMPTDAIDILRRYDAIYFGAVGDPNLPLALPVWGLVLPIRQTLDLFVNLRPVVGLLDASSLRMLIVRENTEGEYLGQGARLYRGTPRESALQLSSYSREGVMRVQRYAFELARQLDMTLTSVTKSNALNYTSVLWDEIFREVGQAYPDVEASSVLVDAAATLMVTRPGRFDVMVTGNLFGDILSDLGAGLVGGLGLAPSANFNPSRTAPALFEPVHGSAPDIAGTGSANPAGAILSAAMMLGYLGYTPWEDRLFVAVKQALARPQARPRDLGGTADTLDVARAVIEQLSSIIKNTELGVGSSGIHH